jgi:hypothetical protein
MSLPGMTEAPHFDDTSFGVRGKIFVTVPLEEDRFHVFVAEDHREVSRDASGVSRPAAVGPRRLSACASRSRRQMPRSSNNSSRSRGRTRRRRACRVWSIDPVGRRTLRCASLQLRPIEWPATSLAVSCSAPSASRAGASRALAGNRRSYDADHAVVR